MIDKARDLTVEDRLDKLGIHWHWEDAVFFDSIDIDPNPARWRERYDEEHMLEIAWAILEGTPIPAFLLYRPPGATKSRMFGGRHRKEALAREIKQDHWPAYVIDQPLEDFLIEALPIYDNVGGKKDYTKAERLDFAAHLTKFTDRDPKIIAKNMQLKPSEVTQHIDWQHAMNRGHNLAVSVELRKLPQTIQIEADKGLPNDLVFKRLVEVLAFTEKKGHEAKGMIKDAATAKSEAKALERLDAIYEKHKLELEKRKRGGIKRTPTLAQKIKRPLMVADGLWPGAIELLEINAHDNDFISELEDVSRDLRGHLNEIIDRCAEVRAMREKYRTERAEAEATGDGARI